MRVNIIRIIWNWESLVIMKSKNQLEKYVQLMLKNSMKVMEKQGHFLGLKLMHMKRNICMML